MLFCEMWPCSDKLSSFLTTSLKTKEIRNCKVYKDVGVKTANKSVVVLCIKWQYKRFICGAQVWVKCGAQSRETRFISVAEWIIVALKTKLIDYLTHLFFDKGGKSNRKTQHSTKNCRQPNFSIPVQPPKYLKVLKKQHLQV